MIFLGLANCFVILGFVADADNTVGDRKFGMQAQVDKGWGVHTDNSTTASQEGMPKLAFYQILLHVEAGEC